MWAPEPPSSRGAELAGRAWKARPHYPTSRGRPALRRRSQRLHRAATRAEGALHGDAFARAPPLPAPPPQSCHRAGNASIGAVHGAAIAREITPEWRRSRRCHRADSTVAGAASTELPSRGDYLDRAPPLRYSIARGQSTGGAVHEDVIARHPPLCHLHWPPFARGQAVVGAVHEDAIARGRALQAPPPLAPLARGPTVVGAVLDSPIAPSTELTPWRLPLSSIRAAATLAFRDLSPPPVLRLRQTTFWRLSCKPDRTRAAGPRSGLVSSSRLLSSAALSTSQGSRRRRQAAACSLWLGVAPSSDHLGRQRRRAGAGRL